MIFTVSTVKDSPANVAAYVERNLAWGADHLLVFLDAADTEVEALLAAHPHVTPVVTDEAYWTPSRPESLNARQVTNANLAMHALAALPGSHWIFHIDADEALQVEREELERLGPEVRVARLAPLEAVSRMQWEGEVTHFKRMLSREEVDGLVRDGLIVAPDPEEPANGSYFRGHVQGKVGVRPNLDLRMQLHRAVVTTAEDGKLKDTVLPPYDAPWLQHLHYESHSGSEFVRKWMAHLGAGDVRFRARRGRLRADIEAIVHDPSLDAQAKQEALTTLYRERIEDDFEALLERGLLVQPAQRKQEPRGLPPKEAADLEAVWTLLLGSDKRYANPQLPQFSALEGFRQLRRHAEGRTAPLLDRAIAAAEQSMRDRGAAEPPAAEEQPRTGLLGRLRRR